MFRISWRKWIFARPRRARPRYRPQLEWLEDRAAPATHVWSGAAGSLMSNANNWSSGGHPASGESTPVILVFPKTQVSQSVIDDISGLFVDQIQFTGAPYTLGGTGVTLNLTGLTSSRPNIEDQVGGNGFSATSLTLNLAADCVINVTAGTLAVDCPVTGPGGAQKTGAGTVSVSTNNSFA